MLGNMVGICAQPKGTSLMRNISTIQKAPHHGMLPGIVGVNCIGRFKPTTTTFCFVPKKH